jgi:predicted esterase
MVHGRNAAPENIFDLVPRLARPDFTYLAPAAANNTWYPLPFTSETEKNEPGLSSALSVLATLVKRCIGEGTPADRVFLLGFSQGACLASEFAVRHATRYGGVIAFSGGLIGPPGTTWKFPGSFDGTPVFLGCSDRDSHIPRARVEESAAVLSRMGATVTTKLYPDMGHLVIDDEIEAAREILDGGRRL